MSERHMTEGERAEALIRWCSLQADLRDYAEFMSDGIEKNRLMVERARFKQIIELLLSTSSAVRGMREALENARRTLIAMRTSGANVIARMDCEDAVTSIDIALSLVEGEDKQARSPSALSAPTTTDTKDTTK